MPDQPYPGFGMDPSQRILAGVGQPQVEQPQSSLYQELLKRMGRTAEPQTLMDLTAYLPAGGGKPATQNITKGAVEDIADYVKTQAKNGIAYTLGKAYRKADVQRGDQDWEQYILGKLIPGAKFTK